MAQLQTNNLTLEYEEIGAKTAEPLVLIMGLGAGLVYWPEKFLQLLGAQNFRVIYFDNRDVGLSEKLHGKRPPNLWKSFGRYYLGKPLEVPYTLVDMADDVVGLLDALELSSAHILGVSMGGMIAQTVAMLYPHRVRSLSVIMSSNGQRRYSIAQPKAIKQLLTPPGPGREGFIAKQISFSRTCGSTGFPRDEESVRTRAGLAFDRGFYPAGFMRQLLAILATGSRHDALRFIRVPTFVAHGSVDPLISPSAGRAIARAIPGAHYQEIKGMGHDLPEGVWPILVENILKLRKRAS